jgi:hypothetical protein
MPAELQQRHPAYPKSIQARGIEPDRLIGKVLCKLELSRLEVDQCKRVRGLHAPGIVQQILTAYGCRFVQTPGFKQTASPQQG